MEGMEMQLVECSKTGSPIDSKDSTFEQSTPLSVLVSEMSLGLLSVVSADADIEVRDCVASENARGIAGDALG